MIAIFAESVVELLFMNEYLRNLAPQSGIVLDGDFDDIDVGERSTNDVECLHLVHSRPPSFATNTSRLTAALPPHQQKRGTMAVARPASTMRGPHGYPLLSPQLVPLACA